MDTSPVTEFEMGLAVGIIIGALILGILQAVMERFGFTDIAVKWLDNFAEQCRQPTPWYDNPSVSPITTHLDQVEAINPEMLDDSHFNFIAHAVEIKRPLVICCAESDQGRIVDKLPNYMLPIIDSTPEYLHERELGIGVGENIVCVFSVESHNGDILLFYSYRQAFTKLHMPKYYLTPARETFLEAMANEEHWRERSANEVKS